MLVVRCLLDQVYGLCPLELRVLEQLSGRPGRGSGSGGGEASWFSAEEPQAISRTAIPMFWAGVRMLSLLWTSPHAGRRTDFGHAPHAGVKERHGEGRNHSPCHSVAVSAVRGMVSVIPGIGSLRRLGLADPWLRSQHLAE